MIKSDTVGYWADKGAAAQSSRVWGGHAKTVHDYHDDVVESVLVPGWFVVPGYPERTMPIWEG
jgi:hypothetical protein